MTINSKNKGATGERELIRLLQAQVDAAGLVGIKLERNLEQTRYGGVDIVGLSWLSGEVKRCEVLQLDQWWGKLIGLTGANQVPAIFYRRNKEPWSVRCRMRLPLSDGRWVTAVASVSLDDWLLWFANELRLRVH